MTHGKNEAGTLLPMVVTEGVTVYVLPNERHEYLMTTKEVAQGYGVSCSVIRDHQSLNMAEFIVGRHFMKAVDIFDTLPKGMQPHQIFWTKRGIVRLGFFIKSERARLFRDWAEDLVLSGGVHARPGLPDGSRRRINRLTPERVIDILSDVCLIEDRALRERIAGKIMGGHSYGH